MKSSRKGTHPNHPVFTFICKILHSRIFKIATAVCLFLLALKMKGEPFTLTALGARTADIIADFWMEGVKFFGGEE